MNISKIIIVINWGTPEEWLTNKTFVVPSGCLWKKGDASKPRLSGWAAGRRDGDDLCGRWAVLLS